MMMVSIFILLLQSFHLVYTWSSVSIATCSVPERQAPLSLCCHTENVPLRASIFFFRYHMTNVVARIQQPCSYNNSAAESLTCVTDGNRRVYNLTYLDITLEGGYGVWGCGFYGNWSTFELNKNNVLDIYLAPMVVHPGEPASLTWQIGQSAAMKDVTIFSPNGSVLLKMDNGNVTERADNVKYNINIPAGNISIMMTSVTFNDNGTYVCLYETSGLRSETSGITLVVLVRPSTPVISLNKSSVVHSSNIAAGWISCYTVSGAAAPLYYPHIVSVVWLLPRGDAKFNTSVNGSWLYVTEYDCNSNLSLPIYCYGVEKDINSYSSLLWYPFSLCPAAGPDVTPSPEEDVGSITALVALVCLFVNAFIFTLVISLVVGRQHVCRKLRKCKKRCRRCRSDSDSDSDSDLDIMLGRERGRRRRSPYRPGRPNSGLEDGLDSVRSDREMQRAIEQILQQERAAAARHDRNEPDANLDFAPRPIDIENDDIELNDPAGIEGADGGGEGEATPPPTNEVAILDQVERTLDIFHNSLGHDPIPLDVSREHIVDNLICHYTEPMLPQSRVTVKMVGEEGMDCGGVTDDMFTTFWDKAQEDYFIGSEAVVPYLPPHKMAEEEKFKVFGRILSHTIALLKAFPIPMCKSTVIVMVYDTTQVAKETLLEDFLLFLDPLDRKLITLATANFSSLSEEQKLQLQGIFARYEYSVIPNEENLNEHLIQLARNEICLKPKPLCELMRSGIPMTHMDIFWGRLHFDHLDVLYRALKPTANRIISRLHISPDVDHVTERQDRAMGYLRKLLRELSQEQLETFLQFITGQKSTPRQRLLVTFTQDRGISRVPKAHTCSNLLELPETYSTYATFKEEFTNLLANDEAMTMSMA